MADTITDYKYRAEMLTRHLTHEMHMNGETLDDLRALAYADHVEREGYAREGDEVVADYLRHAQTSYEYDLQEMDYLIDAEDDSRSVMGDVEWDGDEGEEYCKVKHEILAHAYQIIRSGAMKAIADRFPELRTACKSVEYSKYIYGSSIRRY